jgi:hypothetical protein
VHLIEADAVSNGLPAPERYSGYLRDSGGYTLGGRDMSQDPWETPYTLSIEGDTYSVRSAGPDKEYGTEDDVFITRSVPRW